MKIETIRRSELRKLLDGKALRGGKMLQVSWPRLRDKIGKDENGNRVVLSPAGEVMTRRLILRDDWASATPSKSFEPKGGNMFNVASKEEAKQISAANELYLFLSLEGVTHAEGEMDHPVNVPLKHVTEIVDTRDKVTYVVR